MYPTMEELQSVIDDLMLEPIIDGLRQAETALQKLGYVTHGIESVTCCEETLQYINLGDTYRSTILMDQSAMYVGSWGQWVEETEAEYEAETLSIKCGYCGEFTPNNPNNWRETICEYCGRNVCTGE